MLTFIFGTLALIFLLLGYKCKSLFDLTLRFYYLRLSEISYCLSAIFCVAMLIDVGGNAGYYMEAV